MLLDSAGDIILDADGGDVFFKDAGTTFGSATNTSGNLIIKSGTTTALTFSGANVTAAGTITGNLTGNVTGNASGTALTVTQAAQTAITSVGTLTALQVDNININGNAISSTAGTDLTITPVSGQQIVLDGTIVIDAGVVTGATSVTSTAFVGDITGDVTGNADTATLATTVTITDNESTDENNAVVFTAGGDVDGGNLGLESDGNLTYNPSSGTLNVPNISVTGTQTIVNSVTMNASNAVIFEGATADAHETTLSTVDATADRTINLPNQSGTLPVLAAASATAITSTPEELNLIDGDTARGTTAVASGDGILINDGGTMRMTNVDTVSTYFASHTVGGGNIVTTGALNSGSITSGFGNIDIGSSTFTTTGAVATGTVTATGIVDITGTTDSSDASGDTGILRVEGGASIAKKLYIGTDLDVDGTANLDIVDIDGAVNIAAAVTQSGGVFTQDGGAVFNEGSADVDFRVETNSDTHAFFVDAGDGYVSINGGVSSPQLRALPGGESNGLQIKGNSASSASIGITRHTADAPGPALRFLKSRNTTVNSFTIVNDNDVIGAMEFCADDGTDYGTEGASIRAQINGTPGANDMPTELIFATTADGAASVTDRMKILANGNIDLAGNLLMNGNEILMDDNSQIQLGSSQDLKIYHDGSHSYIEDVGTGNLRIRGQQIEMYNPDGSESIADFNVDGAITLYHNGSSKFATSATGITVTGRVTETTAKTKGFGAQYDGTETNTITLGSCGFKPQALFCIFNVGTSQVASWGMAARDGGHQALLDYDVQAAGDGYEGTGSYFARLGHGSGKFSNLAVSSWNDDEVVIQKSVQNSGAGATCVYRIIVMG